MAQTVNNDLRPNSPAGRSSNRSCSSTSTLDSVSVAYESAPPLCSLFTVREYCLSKQSQTSAVPGWGLVLRGTTSELSEGRKLYSCQIESVHSDGAAKVAGLHQGDQIVGINQVPLKDFQHADVVKIFQSSEQISITVLPSKFHTCSHVRVSRTNEELLQYLWILMRHLHTLEIINITIAENDGIDLCGLISLKCLLINHCSVHTLDPIKGLKTLCKLETLSLAHNVLEDSAFSDDCPLDSLVTLRKLDLSRNSLTRVPLVIGSMRWLEVLVLVDNNISELPHFLCRLKKLHTLCLEGNLFREVDKVLRTMTSIQKLTLANNALEYEPQVVREREFLITSVTNNPFTNTLGIVTRNEPSLRRTLSVRGQLFFPKREQRHSLEWDSRQSEQIHEVFSVQ